MSDVDHRILFADVTLADSLGYTSTDLVGRPAIELVARTYRLPMVLAAESLWRRDEPTAVLDTAFVSAAGLAIPAQVVLSVLPGIADARQPAGLVCTVLIGDNGTQQAGPGGQAMTPDRRQRHVAASDSDNADISSPELAQLLKSAEATAIAVQGLLAATNAAMVSVATRQQMRERQKDRRPAVVGDVDSLTGLATRAVLLNEMREGARDGTDYAVLLVDLDEFKSVNDTHGHDIGDEVLVHVADRLRACVRPDDLVVRFGGDEFVILCRVAQAATAVASRVVSLLAPAIETVAGPIPITASVGISDGRIPMGGVNDLLTRADAAMYWAKQLGKNRFFAYDAMLHERSVREGHVQRLLRIAVTDSRIAVHYQPIMACDGVDVIGVEAVARLIGDDGDLLLPADFLPVAERTGLVATIDAAVLAESCRCIGRLIREIGRPLAVSVNVSRRFIARADLVDVVLTALADADLPPVALMLELTEETLIDAGTAAIARLAELRGHGVQVALDNFGAGFAPLSFLRNLPLSYVKVNRRCIVRMMTDERDAAMIEAVTWLVDRLGIAWIAGGVETDDEWQALRRFGPGLAQGYLFAEPLDENALARHLRAGFGKGGAGHRAGSLVCA
ncbi:MAG: bifunctional diguanylate cyclase/phosphodiesterase [Nakamurella sp.]